jgi:hypothetical protein
MGNSSILNKQTKLYNDESKKHLPWLTGNIRYPKLR